ncbi:MAG TPA: hypothetical protein VFF98_05385 [Novosphingobium sp.]|nr:hypothetical protein [Novosphingobium sp.]
MALIPPSRLAAIPHLGTFLAGHERAVVGWGRKPSGRRAQRLAGWLGRPVALLEDGLLRSVGRGDPPLSLLVDDIGVYYDAAAPSRMEHSIAAGASPRQAARALALAAAWRAGGLSKYNHAPDPAALPTGPYVLLADQCRGDLSIAGAQACAASFARMAEAAAVEFPHHALVLKTHPDAHSHGRASCLPPALGAHPRAVPVADGCHPARLIAGAAAVYTVSSQIGFEALIWGRPLRCFGLPFYAGWGLAEEDRPPPARRAAGARLEDLLHAALVVLARYVDPASGRAWQAEEAFAHVASARRQRARPAG